MCRDVSGMLQGRWRGGGGGNKRDRGKQAERLGRVRSLSFLSLPIARGRVIACDLVKRLCCAIVLLSVCDFIFLFFSDLCASWPLSVI